jgi:signal transduction histidine kinase
MRSKHFIHSENRDVVLKEEIPKVLVVNDDPGSLMALVGLLSSWDKEIPCEIITAQSGEETLRHALLHDFAVILLDVNMPRMDGFETAEAIHLRERSASTPIIFVTAYLADEMNRFKGYQKGAVDYLFTPIIPQILKAKLAVFVGLAKKNLELKVQADALDRRSKELAAINARLEFEINERKAVEHESKAKDQFLAMLGHELRNPLSAICSAASLINVANVKAETVQHAKEVIERQGRHLSRIVDDLLDLSRVMSDKVALNLQPVNLSEIVAACVETLTVTGRTKDYVLDVQTEPAWVNADPTRAEQIITNLLDNALKYTPPGGRITVKVGATANEVELSVHDTGIGMPPALLSRIFNVFVQGERTPDRPEGGLGIGLALVRQLAALHGGAVTAESKGAGFGSSFVLQLPKTGAPTDLTHPPAISPSRERFEVLLIEDNEDARETMSMLLTSYGHMVTQAVDGPDGIQKATARRPDAIVIDIGLPGIDGHEVARRLRASASTGDIPLIALTGYGSEQDRQSAINAGFDVHLVKPVNTNALISAIETCMLRSLKA